MKYPPRLSGTKLCSGPTHEKPIELDVIHFCVQSKNIDGLSGPCRQCVLFSNEVRMRNKKLANWPVRRDKPLKHW